MSATVRFESKAGPKLNAEQRAESFSFFVVRSSFFVDCLVAQSSHLGSKQEVSAEWLQDVLPRACRCLVSDWDGFTVFESADAVGDDAVLCPVSSPDDVPGTGAGDEDRGLRKS